MSKFCTELEMRDNGDGLTFTLVPALIYFSTKFDGYFVVPSGFVTDLASIPQGVQNLIPKLGRWNKAAVVHDLLYKFNGAVPLMDRNGKAFNGSIDREVADGILLEAMLASGVDALECRLIYDSVRQFGTSAWNGHAGEADVYPLHLAMDDFRKANLCA